MLEFVTQLFAAFGPLALTAMGLVVSLKPPRAQGHAHWVWLVAFVLVGLPTAISTFIELRGTDTLLARIWERESKPPTDSKEGARFVLNTGPLNRETKTVEIEAINKGDAVARASVIGANGVVYTDHILTEKEEDEWYGKVRAALTPLGAGVDFLKDGRRTMIVDLPTTDAQFDDMLAKKTNIYLLFVMAFKDETTPPGKIFLATLCVRYQGTLGAPKICFGHNETRQLD